jgi:hypothetical protein
MHTIPGFLMLKQTVHTAARSTVNEWAKRTEEHAIKNGKINCEPKSEMDQSMKFIINPLPGYDQ